jgi:cystathionine gamma-synthase
MNIETLAVHVGREIEEGTRAVTPSITLATTFLREEDDSWRADRHYYTRASNPNRNNLERAIATLEGGATALAFASGMAAASALLQAMRPGDHVILPDDLYHGVRHVSRDIFGRWGLQVSYVDTANLDAVAAAIQKNTRLIWCETPSNPALKVADLARIADLAHSVGAWCACDNTWATPILQRPLELGCDIAWHSTTKYFGGHSDVLGGVVVLKEQGELADKLRQIQTLVGGVPSPFDCWLISRSLPTLPYRVRAQSANALKLAQWLEDHPKVQRVYYPGLASHPGHAIAKGQMRAFGGMLSFEVNSKAEALAVTAKIKVFTRATSLGGVESLMEHRASVEGPDTLTPQGLIRTSVGLEHCDDLIADLAQALASAA